MKHLLKALLVLSQVLVVFGTRCRIHESAGIAWTHVQVLRWRWGQMQDRVGLNLLET